MILTRVVLTGIPSALAQSLEIELSVNIGFSVATEFTADGPEGLAIVKGGTPAEDRLLAPHGFDCGPCAIEVYDTAGTSMGSIPTAWDEIRGIDRLPNGNLVIASLTEAAGTVNVISSNTPLIPLGPFTPPVPLRQRFVVEIETSGATQPGGILLNLTGEMPDATVVAGPGFPFPDPSDIEIEVLHLVDQLESVLVFDASTLYVGEEGPDPDEPDSSIIEVDIGGDNTSFTFGTEFPAGVEPFDDVSGMDLITSSNEILSVDDSSEGAAAMFRWELDGTQVAMSAAIFSVLTDPNIESQLIGVCPAGGCTDPEGVAFDDDTGMVWVAFENDRAIIGFEMSLVPKAVDTDEDGIPDESDNCPNVANGNPQEDTDANGIGDACQCGDVTGDGFTNVSDALAIARGQIGAENPNFGKCDVNEDTFCNVSDALKIARGQQGSAPEGQLCPTYQGP